MKNSTKTLLSIAAAGIMMFSCSPSRIVSFNVNQPAEITFPSEANTILLVDRTKLANEKVNIIEGILTGELPSDDKAAAQEALMGLMNSLNNSPRFNVKLSPERLKGNSLTAAFPDALSWDVIDKLCKTNNADIVIALEVFDSNFLVTNGKRMKKKFVGEGANKREVEYPEFFASGVGSVKMGIRVYYNKDKTIVDQQMFNPSNSWEGAGSTPMEALSLLINKSNANKYLATSVGENYAYKISPLPIRITREFYGQSKKVNEVAAGSRYADVAQWDEAINEWKKGLQKAEKKDAGMIAYNIAIGYEVLGQYGTALTWAQDSYTKYGNPKGRDYVQNLRRRINEETILKNQMNN